MNTLVGLADGHQPFDSSEIELLIQYVLSHKKNYVQQFLRDHNLPVSGTKEELKERLETQVSDEQIAPEDLVGLLNEVEGWGDQHIYLYESPPGETAVWKSEAKARARLDKLGAGDLFNKRLPVLIPDEPKLSSVEWSSTRVRFVWIEKREWTTRRADLDKPSEAVDGFSKISFKAYEDRVTRGITTFDWNLATNSAALMIQRLPSGEHYDEIRREYENAIEDAVHLSDFARWAIAKAIKKLEKSVEVRNRQVAHETQRGGRVQYTSGSRKQDAFEDPDMKNSRDALGRTSSVMGNFYWQEKQPHLVREIHTKLYATDQRIGIFGECTEEEVQYVLSRIRHHSR